MLHFQGCGALAIHDGNTGGSASSVVGHSTREDDQWLSTNNNGCVVAQTLASDTWYR
jgi:hypothetical protein